MKPDIRFGITVGVVITFVGLAALVYRADSTTVDSYRSVAATAIETDGSDTNGYPYIYRVGDRLCHGTSFAALDPSTSFTVYYDSRDVCTSLPYDPGDERIGHLMLLGLGAAYIVFFLAVTGPGRGSRELTWQRT